LPYSISLHSPISREAPLASRFEFSDLDWQTLSFLRLKIPMPVFLLTTVLISFSELTLDGSSPLCHFFLPLFLLTDRFLVQSIAISSAFSFQAALFFGAFHLLFFSGRLGALAILSLLIAALATAQRPEFVVMFIPALLYALFVSRRPVFAGIGLVGALSVIAIVDRTIGSPKMCLNMHTRLRARAFARTDTNGLAWAATVAAALAVWTRMDGRWAVALGIAAAAGAALALPVGSAADRDLAGVMVLRLLGYLWIAVIVGRQGRRPALLAIGAIAAGVVAARVLPWQGQGVGIGVL
jgi:hypothetical protein